MIAAGDAASKEQARREADVLRQVRDVATLGGGDGLLWQKRHQEVDLFFLAMDYIPGETLTEMMSDQGPLAEATAIELAIALAEWLEALHSRHIIHRDVKPDNVMLLKLGKRYQPILVDYGIAKVGNRTMRGARAATDGYAPPEQYKGGTDHRADVYALGATLFEMLTGETPPVSLSRDPRESLKPRQVNPAISLEMELVIQVATAYYPRQRFATMGAMIDALRLAQGRDTVALWAMLQALGLLGDREMSALVSSPPPASIPLLPPLPPKRSKKQRAVICPCCQQQRQVGEMFCGDCGAALDPSIKAGVAPAQSVPGVEVGGDSTAGRVLASRTPGPQAVSLLFTQRIVLGGPALGALGKGLVILAYWFLLAGIALGGRSLSITLSLMNGLAIVCLVFFLLLFPLFFRLLKRRKDIVITRRGQAHWLRRSVVMLLGLVGLAGFLYWLVVEVTIYGGGWFLAPPPLSILVYAGLACSASLLIAALLA